MLTPGTVLGERYEIIEKIGAGGMSIVYKARCNRLERYVAIKVLREEFAKDDAFLKKFRAEALSAASLSHPNIVGIYDVGHDHERHYIVMELVEGETLKELIAKEGPLPSKVVLEYGLQILGAVRHAHRKQIIHRDIKPQNILVTHDKILKVTDFGIARAVDSSTIVAAGNAIGSVHYFSPEQAKGKYINETSDLYSCGIVLFELATNKLPFEADSHVSIALKHINEDIPRPSTLVPDLYPGLEQIILRATDKKQENRYQTAEDMIHDVKEVMSNPSYVAIEPVIDDLVENTILLTPEETEQIREQSKELLPKASEIKVPLEPLHTVVKDDDEEEVSPAYKVLVAAGAILGTLVLVGIIAYAAIFWMPSWSAPKHVAVPNVVGQTVEQATLLVADKDLKLEVMGTRADGTVTPGTILEQDPKREDVVKPGTVVGIILAKGEEETEEITMVTVPDVVGLSVGDAQRKLKEMNLYGRVAERVYDEEVEAGKIIDVKPAPGSSVSEDEVIELVVSNGPEVVYCTVPNLYNLDKANAELMLRNAELKLGKVTEETSETVEKGLVVSQTLLVNTQVEKDTAVDIVISSGPAEVIPPVEDDGVVPPEEGGETTTPEQPGVEEPVQNTKTYVLEAPRDNSKEEYHVMINFESQDGSSNTVYDKVVKKEQFPLPIQITGSGKGQLKVYFDAVEEYNDPIDFNEVTE
ncbi:MAG: Stk1 family PASTA domain-containing Ser/Thr kinase [Cellulosilyticaceae bacterium]